MVFILRRLLVFALQFVTAWAVVVAICCGFAFYGHGLDYRHTPQFAAQWPQFVRLGLLGAGLICLVLVCYASTKGTLRPPPPDDNNLF